VHNASSVSAFFAFYYFIILVLFPRGPAVSVLHCRRLCPALLLPALAPKAPRAAFVTAPNQLPRRMPTPTACAAPVPWITCPAPARPAPLLAR
jgi:hypothetical protein